MTRLVSKTLLAAFHRQSKPRVHCSPCGIVRTIEFLCQSFFIEENGLKGRAPNALIEAQRYVKFA
jgi:hypothetical protein